MRPKFDFFEVIYWMEMTFFFPANTFFFLELQNYMLLYTNVVPKDRSSGTTLPRWLGMVFWFPLMF
jgi:hypothetical protein